MGIVTQVRVDLRRETLGTRSIEIDRGLTPRPFGSRVSFGNRGVRIGVVKLLRARGGCLGVIRETGVEGCDKSGGVAQRTSIPECL